MVSQPLQPQRCALGPGRQITRFPLARITEARRDDGDAVRVGLSRNELFEPVDVVDEVAAREVVRAVVADVEEPLVEAGPAQFGGYGAASEASSERFAWRFSSMYAWA